MTWVPEVHCKSWTASMSTVQKSSMVDTGLLHSTHACSPALAMNLRHPCCMGSWEWDYSNFPIQKEASADWQRVRKFPQSMLSYSVIIGQKFSKEVAPFFSNLITVRFEKNGAASFENWNWIWWVQPSNRRFRLLLGTAKRLQGATIISIINYMVLGTVHMSMKWGQSHSL